MRRLLAVTALMMLTACSIAPQTSLAVASEPLDGAAAAYAPVMAKLAPQPFGYRDYCREQTSDSREERFRDAFCQSTEAAQPVALTAERASLLDDVQRQVNAAISYSSTSSWEPLAGRGDCKTFAARKALELLNRGWPASSLRIATAFVNDGSRQQLQYHAVLLVDTDQGTIVLDSRYSHPRRWADLSYIWMEAQLPGRKGGWTRLPADPQAVSIALAANGLGAVPGASTLR